MGALRRSMLVLVTMLACTPAKTDAARADAATASAPIVIDAGAPELHAYSYAELCGDVQRLDGTASPSPTPSASAAAPIRVVDVRFRSRVTKQPSIFHAEIVASSQRTGPEVYAAAADDPYHCCARKEGASLVFVCGASGIDLDSGRGSARQEGDDLVIRWCTATAQRIVDRGEQRVPLHGATARFVTTPADCPPSTFAN